MIFCLQVPPEQFCDIMWAGDLHYKDHQCDFLAAYVAVCYTHQVCISWRRHNFCRKEVEKCTCRCAHSCFPFAHALLNACIVVALRCPPGKEYQPCVSTCTSRTCLNREYYEESTCSFIREECVCRSGTILHRADSPYCVTEDRCGERVITSLCHKDMKNKIKQQSMKNSILVLQWYTAALSVRLLGSDVFSMHG